MVSPWAKGLNHCATFEIRLQRLANRNCAVDGQVQIVFRSSLDTGVAVNVDNERLLRLVLRNKTEELLILVGTGDVGVSLKEYVRVLSHHALGLGELLTRRVPPEPLGGQPWHSFERRRPPKTPRALGRVRASRTRPKRNSGATRFDGRCRIHCAGSPASSADAVIPAATGDGARIGTSPAIGQPVRLTGKQISQGRDHVAVAGWQGSQVGRWWVCLRTPSPGPDSPLSACQRTLPRAQSPTGGPGRRITGVRNLN